MTEPKDKDAIDLIKEIDQAIADAEILLLNREKFKLRTYPYQTAQDWLDLAKKYKAVGSRANLAGCVWQARKLGATKEQIWAIQKPEPADKPLYNAKLPDQSFPWQKQKDLK